MQDGSEDMNKTVKAMICKALNAMTVESDDGAFAWVAEMANSTWNSKCSRHDDENEIFLCLLSVLKLCFSCWEFKKSKMT